MIPFVLSFALMTAYWPDIGGAAVTPRWDVGAALVVALFFAPRVKMTAAHWVGLALIAWLLVTLSWTASPLDGIDAAFKLILIGAAFALGSTLTSIRPLIAGAAVGLAVSSVIVIAQWFGWDAIESYARPAGLFYNGNRLAEVAALVFAAALSVRMWWALPLLVPAIVIPQGRAAWLAVIAVLAVWTWQRLRMLPVTIIGVVVVALGIVAQQRGFDVGVSERLALWKDTIAGLSFFGHGLGSFFDTFTPHAFDATLSRPEHPHNEWLWLAYEGGALAVVLGAGLAVAIVRQCAGSSRLVLVALATISLFAMPFHDPATVLFCAVCAGFAVGAGGHVRDQAIIGGMALRLGIQAATDRRNVSGHASGIRAISVRTKVS